MRACSSPSSTPLSGSQKAQSSRHWTEPITAAEAQTAGRAVLMSCQAKMTDVVGGRVEARRRSPDRVADKRVA